MGQNHGSINTSVMDMSSKATHVTPEHLLHYLILLPVRI